MEQSIATSGEVGPNPLEPRVGLLIVETVQEADRWQQAAELAGGTMIEVLPGDVETILLYIDKGENGNTGADIGAYVQMVLDSGSTFLLMTEDMEYRESHPIDVWACYARISGGSANGSSVAGSPGPSYMGWRGKVL
ncbi:MAG TPA: hypothetical protein VLG47_00275 [Candidatus Saccharimonadales bacterium]|nr:hypothetical protein [Candidatus Saccharimonadales bacterium]